MAEKNIRNLNHSLEGRIHLKQVLKGSFKNFDKNINLNLVLVIYTIGNYL